MKGIILFLLKTPDFSKFISEFGYMGIYIWFISFDQLTPLPEEISLLVVGYLVAHHIFNPILAGIFSIAGFLTIDVLYFYLAKGGSKLVENKIKKPQSGFINSFKEKLRNHMPKTIIILCFIPRMRLWVPIMAGSMKLPFKKFLLFDTIGLSIFTTVYITLGIIFHASIASLAGKVKGMQHVIFIITLAVIALIMVLFVRRISKNKKENQVA